MIEYSEEGRSVQSGGNMSDVTTTELGWLPTVISYTPVIASKIWTILEIQLAIVLPFGENET
jgi:hypothetical protein